MEWQGIRAPGVTLSRSGSYREQTITRQSLNDGSWILQITRQADPEGRKLLASVQSMPEAIGGILIAL